MTKKTEPRDCKTGVAAWKEETGESSRHSRASSDKRKRVVALVALFALCVASVVCFMPLKQRITRGLWLKEGAAVTIAVTTEDGKEPTADELSKAAAVVRERLASTSLSEYDVQAQGENKLVLTLPWNVDAEAIARILGGAGRIEFARFDTIGDADALIKINAGTSGVKLQDGTYTSFMDDSMIESASVVDAGSGTYAVTFTFDEEGKKLFADVTKELAEEDSGRIAIVVDGAVITAPSVSEEIADGVVSVSGFTKNEADALASLAKGSTLSIKTTIEGTESTEPLVGKQMLWGLTIGALVLIAGVTIAAFVKFGKLAVLVGGSLVVFALTMLGMMAIGSLSNMFVLTMPGVLGGTCAAGLTAVSVWLMVADFHKKVSEGRNVRGAAMSAPRDGMRCMLMPVVVLAVLSAVAMFVPIPAVRETGTTFVLGVVSGVLATFWYAVTLLRLLASTSMQSDPDSWGIKASASVDATASEVS